MYHLYILHSETSGKYYIGQTNNIDRRLEEHNSLSINSFTSKYRPWSLMISIPFENRSQAMKAEKYLKKKPRDFIRRVIADQDLQEYIVAKYQPPG